MGYGYESKLVWNSQLHTATATDLTATGDVATTFKIAEPIRVVEVGVLVTEATYSATAVVVAFDKRVTIGSDTNRVDAGLETVTVPVSTAAGKYVYSTCKVDLSVGDEIVPEITTAAGGAAGAGHFIVKFFNRNETMANQDDAVLSA